MITDVPSPAVRLEAVSIRYGNVLAVDRASAALPRGAVGLLGRNGAGKSSILKALLGLVRPSGGRLEILSLSPTARGEEIRRRVGYMPERDAWISGLNGFETVRLAARLTGVPALDAARRAHEVLYLVGLGDQRYRPVAGYSTGMRQKTKLAVALVHDPELLLLDEPTNGLDPRGRVEMLALIRDLVRELRKSVVISTHILQDVETVCEAVVLMDSGRIVAAGPLEELTRSPVRTLVLEAVAEDGPLQEALRRRGVLAIDSVGAGSYRLTVPATLAARQVFAAVVDVGGTVLRLLEHRRTLEEVFLASVGREVPA